MRKVFSGKCRGGPKDGESFAHDAPHFNVALRPRFTFDKIPDAMSTVKIGTYVFHFGPSVWVWDGPEDEPVEKAAEYCRSVGCTPAQLRGMVFEPSGTVMEGDFEKAVWACLRKRR